MKTLIITQRAGGRLEFDGNVTDVIERIGIIESARILTRCELITRYKLMPSNSDSVEVVEEGR